MKAFNHSCQGESHKATGKVCQDASFSSVDEHLSVGIVCDGHGGSRYFRSDVGAQLAVYVTLNCVRTFVEDVDKSLLEGKAFTMKRAVASETMQNATKDTWTDKAFRQLFSSIIYNWGVRIAEHTARNPLSDDERSRLEPRHADAFSSGRGIEKTYGCTLMCYVQTPAFWFAFHIGDGKCIAFDKAGDWSEPIPWDERCFLNKTTSLCDSDAIDEFRYCYCGDGSHPLAVFLGSDGIDDSFGETENMVNFYVQVLKSLSRSDNGDAVRTIVETLPELSRRGSKDDMSVSCVYDEGMLEEGVKRLTAWQIKDTEDRLSAVNGRIVRLREDLARLGAEDLGVQKNMIDFRYAQKDLAKAFEMKRELAGRWNKFSKEVCGDGFMPYDDSIGLSDVTDEDGEGHLSETDDGAAEREGGGA